jgi:hypothetical protein
MTTLRQHISSNPSSSANPILHLAAADSLAETFNDTFGCGSKPALPAFAWLYRLDDDFICQVQIQEPIPLLLLAYFAISLIPIEDHWFIEGWTVHIIHTI